MMRRNIDENGDFGHILEFNFRMKHFGRLSKIILNAGCAAIDIWKRDRDGFELRIGRRISGMAMAKRTERAKADPRARRSQ